MTNYVVKQGESILDVTLNATGSKLNLDKVLNANKFTSWTPVLVGGQSIIIPDDVVFDTNTKRQLDLYPAVNNVNTDVNNKINDVFALMSDNWILTTGFWNDGFIWYDNKFWRD